MPPEVRVLDARRCARPTTWRCSTSTASSTSGRDAVPGAPGHVDRARAAGMRLAFITNNALRPPGAVAAHLRELGVEADAEDVVTSAQAAARVLVERLGAGARVVLLGADGLAQALRRGGPGAGARRRGRRGAW